jgi:arsenate reductase (thioredoxin)
MQVEVLVTRDCPHAPVTLERVEAVLDRLAPEAELRSRVVTGADFADRFAFPGSPTVRIDGVDLEGEDVGPPAMACRRYPGGGGAPPEWLVEAGVLRALAPRHILFLCVANSARSQMAEGIARALAPAGVTISSAGSEPGVLNPLAVRALAELGLDSAGQRSKGLDEVDADTVDAVITLCAEEVCPAWLGRAHRVHWGLPDPAAAAGGEEARLDAFRQVRDELRLRLARLFPAPPAAA